MTGKTIDQLRPGDRAEISKTISEGDIYLYAGITGDINPAHLNEEYAKGTFFKTRIAHGLLVAGLISAVLANQLPGPGTIYIRQELDFRAPVHIGDTVTASAEVTDMDVERNRVVMRTLCRNQRGETVIEGKAVVSPPKKAKAGKTG